MKATVSDGLGHSIYLTEERWQHIVDEHPEMKGWEQKALDTLRLGRRFQDSARPDVFLYYRDFPDHPAGNTAIVVVVRVGFRPDGSANNFVLTAYRIFRVRS